MELYNQILKGLTTQKLSKGEADLLVGKACYSAIKEIQEILALDSIEYIEFYDSIEEIVYLLVNGRNTDNNQHEFG